MDVSTDEQRSMHAERERILGRLWGLRRRSALAMRHARALWEAVSTHDAAVRALSQAIQGGCQTDGDGLRTVILVGGVEHAVIIRIAGGVVNLESEAIDMGNLPDVPVKEI